MAEKTRNPAAPHRADFAVAAIIPESYKAVTRTFGLKFYDEREGYQWTWGYVDVRRGGSVTVVCGAPLDRENVATAIFVDALLRAWRPHNLLLVDIGGGVNGQDGVRLGDVVTHTVLHYYDFKKTTRAGGDEPRYFSLPGASTRLRELSRRPGDRHDDSWLDDLHMRRPGAGVPIVHSGEMLSGGTILADSPILRRLLKRYTKVLAVEMEGVGTGRAIIDSGLLAEPPEYLIVRGISDFCNVDQSQNQRTRESWKRYAAQAAAAHAKAIVREAMSTSAGAPPTPSQSFGTGIEPRFALRAEHGGGRYPVEELANEALMYRRLALVGPAGAGKSVAIASASGTAPREVGTIVVALSRWNADRSTRLLKAEVNSGNIAASLDILLEAANVDITVDLLIRQVEIGRILLVVDGVNEATPDVAARIIEVLDQSVRRWSGLCVIVTDRNQGRYECLEKWATFSLLPVSDNVASVLVDATHGPGTWQNLAGKSRSLLTLPFFLDLCLKGSEPVAYSRAGALDAFVRQQTKVDDQVLTIVQKATSAAYSIGQRFLPPGSLPENARVVLSQGGIFVQNDGDAEPIEFSHQLLGDFFASLHLAESENDWNSAGFDSLTFSAESFDSVTLAAEQIHAVERGDRYLRAVYDWNWRAAVDCLLNTDTEQSPFSVAAKVMTIGLLNERRTDPVDGTRKRSQAMLSSFSEPAVRAIATASAEQARDILSQEDYPEPFPTWRAVYSRHPQRSWSDAELAMLCSEDPLLGWTVSYVLKRSELAPDVRLRLKGVYAGASASLESDSQLRSSIRWRVVFALGAAPGDDTLDVLLTAFDTDPHSWVRWCAGRSITEIAARTSDPILTDRALSSLGERAPKLSDPVADEIAWVAQYHNASPQFFEPMRALLIVLQSTRRTGLSIDRWSRILQRFDDFWNLPPAGH